MGTPVGLNYMPRIHLRWKKARDMDPKVKWVLVDKILEHYFGIGDNGVAIKSAVTQLNRDIEHIVKSYNLGERNYRYREISSLCQRK